MGGLLQDAPKKVIELLQGAWIYQSPLNIGARSKIPLQRVECKGLGSMILCKMLSPYLPLATNQGVDSRKPR